jgi:rubrerythrin
MVTIRGREVDVSRFTYELLELDMDAVETYRISAERIQDGEARRTLQEFMRDHERHIEELTPIAQRMGSSPPPAIDVERVKAKVTLSRMGGDRGILANLKEMEDGTNLAYEQGTQDENLDEDVKDVFERGLQDERRHRAWLEERIEQMGLRVTAATDELEEDEDVEEGEEVDEDEDVEEEADEDVEEAGEEDEDEDEEV